MIQSDPLESMAMTVITPDKRIVDHIDDSFGKSESHWISEPGDLTQFGSFIEVLYPGAKSSTKHWHSDEDEMIYVLEGAVTLFQGDETFVLKPGDAATFKAGEPVGHCFQNLSGTPTKYLVVGTRAVNDVCTYPDHDRVCRREDGQSEWFDSAGRPAESVYADVV
jgi:uncharacterized cupin superfamily protein